MKAIERVNENGLTYEKLKSYKGFENVTEEEAKNEIQTIKKLARILHFLMLEEQRKENEGYENENE
jgi:hypothetical protein